MSDRDHLLHLVDRARRGTILDAELDQLAAELDQLAAGITEQAARITTLEHVAAGNRRHVAVLVPELERAEAAIARVRAVLDGIEIADLITTLATTPGDVIAAVRAALDEQPAT